MTLVGTASVTRPFKVALPSTGGGGGAGDGATGGGSTDGAVGEESSRLQPPAASAAPSVTAINSVEDTPAFDLVSACVPNSWHFTPADGAIGTPRALPVQQHEAI